MVDHSASTPGSGARSPLVDVLRGLSILAVVLLHIDIRIPFAKSPGSALIPREISRIVFRSGYFGVRVFFVVSGFLITTTMLRRWRTIGHVDVKAFYQLRVARIAPCLLVLLGFLSALHVAGAPGFVITRTSLGSALFAALTFHVNRLEIAVGYLPATWDVLWSLSVEEVFYVVYPPLVRLAKWPWLLGIGAVLVVVGPLARTVWAGNDLAADYSYLAGFDCIALGCLAAFAAHRWPADRRTVNVGLAMGASLVLLVIVFRGTAYWLHLGNLGLDVTALALGTALLLWSSETAPIRGSYWSTPWLAPVRWMGQCSYEVYLTHSFVTVWGFMLFQRVGSPNRYVPLWDLGMVLISAALGWLVATSFSEPANRYLRRRFKTR
jgi:peptidoglycan/LPS O-acetylase OafA/YrhL